MKKLIEKLEGMIEVKKNLIKNNNEVLKEYKPDANAIEFTHAYNTLISLDVFNYKEIIKALKHEKQ